MLKKQSFSQRLIIWLLALSTVFISGCGGCRDDSDDKTAEEIKKEEEEKKKEADKPNFETEAAVVYPGQYTDELKKNRTKRGHWITADFRLTANKFDTSGDLTANSYAALAPVPVENTDYFAVASRPFSVAKGEQKNLSCNVYLPRRDKGANENIMFNMQRSSGGLAQYSELHGVQLMKPFQYHMVLLTKRPDRYSYYEKIDSVKMELLEGTRPLTFYTLVRTNPSEEPIALPRQALYWTTIAYLIWDDLDVDQLDAEQQQALVDWLHFGGQLILSGPDCLEKLSNSFLADFLPAKVAGSRNLTANDFKEINRFWAVKDTNQDLRRKIVVNDRSPIIGIDFEPHPESSFVNNTGKIAVERPVGRGRIVATAFSMDDKPIIRWPSYRSFFNGALLRKPARRFGKTPDGDIAYSWVDDATTIFDPLLGSTLRYLSRDLVHVGDLSNPRKNGTPSNPNVSNEMITGYVFGTEEFGYPGQIDSQRYRTMDAKREERRNLTDHWHYGGFNHDDQAGTSGWNDESAVSIAARETLRKAAGISPPSSGFVLKMLSIYLLVLVPVNWALFRAIGRVEWAWIAAPFIAIAGALMVAKMAALDIGFVRSNSQVACLEVYADYPRAHIAQYSALYTSLSTGYDLELDNLTAQALPLGEPYRRWEEKTHVPVTIRQTIKNRLEDFQVQSNTTGMLHSEMMLDMQGAFSWNNESGNYQVENNTAIDLSEAAVLRRTAAGKLEAVWIGDLASLSSTDNLQFESIDDVTDPWNESGVLFATANAAEYWQQLAAHHLVNDDNVTVVKVSDIRDNIPPLSEKWPEFIRLLQRIPDETRVATAEQRYVPYAVFRDILNSIERSNSINVSAMFRQIARSLELAKGEVRLIGVTEQTLGSNAFIPGSTQTQQQTLVVVHLERPGYLVAKPDANATDDFTGRSDLDWEQEEKEDSAFDELEELSKDLDDEEE